MVEMNKRFIPATSVREMFGFGDLLHLRGAGYQRLRFLVWQNWMGDALLSSDF